MTPPIIIDVTEKTVIKESTNPETGGTTKIVRCTGIDQSGNIWQFRVGCHTTARGDVVNSIPYCFVLIK